MKKLLVVLLSLGLIVAFGATASAADLKVGGSYYVAGVYDNNAALAPSASAYSRAYFFQRVRLQPEFKIAEGLTFTTRMDALEKQWGNNNWKGNGAVGDDGTSSRPSNGISTNNVQESIEFERAYVTFLTKIGQFQVGYQSINGWGTAYGDSETTGARILYATAAGPVTLLAIYEKMYEADRSTLNAGKVDMDNDTYSLAGIYNAKGIEAGLLLKYYAYKAGLAAVGATGRTGNGASKFWLISPYAKATFGPVFVEAEVNYFTGKMQESETAGVADLDYKAWTGYLHGKMTFGPAYAGALFSYASGDNDATDNEFNTAHAGGGTSWNPALLLMNDDISTWAGSVQGGTVKSQKTNVLFYKIYGGFNPTAKLNMEMGLIYATADKVATNYDKKYGMEADITATYKLYDNLSYMVGAAYLWAGDYFKKGVATATVENDYLLMNKLTLSF